MVGGPVAVLRRVVEAFNDLGVPYLIGGSVATMLYGIPRLTRDVDFVAAMDRRHVLPLVERLQDEFYIDEFMIREAIERQGSFNVIHLESSGKADVFIMKRDRWSALQMQRRQARSPDPNDASFEAFFSSAEDNILNKLAWFRLGGEASNQQWNDILGVLKVQRESLDREYLREWARELDLTNLLNRALNDAGLAL